MFDIFGIELRVVSMFFRFVFTLFHGHKKKEISSATSRVIGNFLQYIFYSVHVLKIPPFYYRLNRDTYVHNKFDPKIKPSNLTLLHVRFYCLQRRTLRHLPDVRKRNDDGAIAMHALL